jgi:predicted DCC family thiol-disulfide oxidoreductase YuxK
MEGHTIVLFDGVCNYCNGRVNFVIKRDKKDRFRFAALQSDAGKAMLKKYNVPAVDLSSFVLIEDGKYYLRSTAALRLLKKLGGIYSLMYAFMIVPRFLRDRVYNYVARNRYRWFGKMESCMVPTEEVRGRFL